MTYTSTIREHTMTVGENFPSTGTVRPSAAAGGRGAGPVLAPLRAAGPAAARTKRPDDRGQNVLRPPGLMLSAHAVVGRPGPAFSTTDPRHGRPPPVKAVSLAGS